VTAYQIGMTPQFRDALDRLAPTARGEVVQAALRVQDGTAAAHVHKLESTDFVAFGVNRNALRVIALREADALILLHVDAHDDAYAWATRHRAVRVGSVIRFVSLATEEAPAEVAAVPGPLAGVRDRVFAKFGIGAHAAAALRRVATEDEVIELAEAMRPALAEAVLGLATTPDDLASVLAAFERASDEPSAPVTGPFWLAPSARALQAALEGTLRDWQVFLHPSQRALVTKRFAGPVKVTGGPGTGKTVVAVHRARFLAESVFPEDPRPVLVTTFGRTLAEQLEVLVDQVCEDAPHVRARVEVRTLVEVAQAVLRSHGRPAGLVTEVESAWARAMEAETLGLPRRFYAAEREHVVARVAAWTEDQYLVAARVGRPERLDRAKKRAIWRVLDAFERELVDEGGGDAIALGRDAARLAVDSPWSAVVCDEVQDASATDLRLLSVLAGGNRPDGLFLCGDGYQRLYTRAVPLSACGIEVRGRSRELRLNYRTTEGIRRAAVDTIAGVEQDALDDEDSAGLDGYRSLRGGPAPERKRFPSAEDEARWVAALARPLLVLTRTRAYRDALAERLRAHGVEVHVLEGRGDLAPAGVTLCTLHRAKGLEAPSVVIAGAHLVPARFPGGDASDRVAWERGERCLLYVGMTRARDWCAVSRVEESAGP
jgi:superfamily I DNA/RNA helicase